MNNSQRIAIIGNGLTGSTTAYFLAKLGFKIDLLDVNHAKSKKPTMQLSLSDNSIKNLEKFGIKNIKNKSCKVKDIFLYDSFYKIDSKSDLIFSKKNEKNLAYIVSSNLLYQEIYKLIKQNKNIVITKKSLNSISENNSNVKIIYEDKTYQNYSLAILTLKNSIKFSKKEISPLLIRNYKETSNTFIITHKKISNNTARQFFLKDGPLAFLPLSNKKTFVIWSIKNDSQWSKNIENKKKVENFLNLKFSEIFGKISLNTAIEKFDLNFYLNVTKKLNRTILLGEALNQFHPIAGQGWNMTLRNILSLFFVVKRQQNIGLEIGGGYFIKKYQKEIKSKNFIFSILIDGIRKSFDINNERFAQLRKITANILNKNLMIKQDLIDIADKGLSF